MYVLGFDPWTILQMVLNVPSSPSLQGLFALNKLAFDRFLSKGQVSSRSAIVLDCLDSMTKSGLEPWPVVTRMSLGMTALFVMCFFGQCTLQGLLLLLS